MLDRLGPFRPRVFKSVPVGADLNGFVAEGLAPLVLLMKGRNNIVDRIRVAQHDLDLAQERLSALKELEKQYDEAIDSRAGS